MEKTEAKELSVGAAMDTLVKDFLWAEAEWKSVDSKIAELVKVRSELEKSIVQLRNQIAERLGIGL